MLLLSIQLIEIHCHEWNKEEENRKLTFIIHCLKLECLPNKVWALLLLQNLNTVYQN